MPHPEIQNCSKVLGIDISQGIAEFRLFLKDVKENNDVDQKSEQKQNETSNIDDDNAQET